MCLQILTDIFIHVRSQRFTTWQLNVQFFNKQTLIFHVVVLVQLFRPSYQLLNVSTTKMIIMNSFSKGLERQCWHWRKALLDAHECSCAHPRNNVRARTNTFAQVHTHATQRARWKEYEAQTSIVHTWINNPLFIGVTDLASTWAEQ